MNIDFNIVYFLSLLILMPVVAYGLAIVYNNLKNIFNDNFSNLSSIIYCRKYIDFNKTLTVSDYEPFHKYQIWKLYNQY